MKKQIILASSNKGKIKEFQEMLKEYDVVSYMEYLPELEIEETGETFYENAKIKATAVWKKLKQDVLADDSGLMVDALEGAPGVRTARYAGENATDEENINKLLNEMKGKENRGAKFCCQLMMIKGNGERVIARGETKGRILKRRSGTNGFGYDPIFYSEELGKSFGKAQEEEKNEISHRGRALRKLKTLL